ncbi:hypothetical protein BH09BAC5_BH09BAC5_21630 [soil metagenome]
MKNNSNPRFRLKIISGISLAIIIFLGVQYFSGKNISNLINSQEDLLKSNAISRECENIQSSIEAYDNEISSFALSGNKMFIQNNEENQIETSASLQQINEICTDNSQKPDLLKLDSLIKAEIKFNQKVLIHFSNANTSEAIALINTQEGKNTIKAIKNISDQIQKREDIKVTKLIAQRDSSSEIVGQMDYAASALAIIVICICAIILFKDINKREKIESQLRAAQKEAENAALIKEQFMANMSHEIRTPLNAILGFSKRLTKTPLEINQQEYVEAINSSGENLLNIVNDVLDFSKIEAEMLHLDRSPFDLKELLSKLELMFRAKADEKGIQLEFQFNYEKNETLSGDPFRLSQILINLVGNALKFTSKGKVGVYVSESNRIGNTVRIHFEIKDSGVGIPADQIDKIFNRFEQGNAETTRNFGGTGLGLTIVKKLVELHGGSIHVDSSYGIGSVFSFSIPYELATEPKTNIPKINSPTIIDMRLKADILVAEDNILNQKLISELLLEWGMKCDLASSGRMAVDLAEKNHYDLILMDIQMPELNGYQATLEIRNRLKSDIPVIAMTAHVFPEEKEKCKKFGMTDYISKPIQEKELFALLSNYLNKNTAVSPEIMDVAIIQDQLKITSLDYLNELSCGSPDFVTKMIALFLSENPEELIALKNYIAKSEFENIRQQAHKMKSTVVFVGLNILANNELNEIENLAAGHSEIDRIKLLFERVEKICSRATKELRAA